MSDRFDLTPQPQPVCGFMPEDLAQVMSDLLPVGFVWPRDRDSVQQRTIAGLAMEYARVYLRDCDLLSESYPCGALETLTDWERVLGLPDACTGLLDTIQQRRAAICAKMAVLGSATLQGVEDYLNDLGYNIEVEEGPERFDFTVWSAADSPVWFRSGGSVSGERIRTWGNKLLECGIEYIKPAHTRPVLHYLVPTTWDEEQTVWDDNETFFDAGVRPPPGWEPPPHRGDAA